MNYKEVSEILESGAETEHFETLKLMEELCGKLARKREERGAFFFDVPEAKITLDDQGVPIDISIEKRGIASEIIEEFMILCNETVAKGFGEGPFIFRIHEEPTTEKVDSLNEALAVFGHRLDMSLGFKGAIQKLLDDTEDSWEGPALARAILRSFMRAKYSSVNIGHFGLASTDYCHFTSPIRRYPDLQIHRIIKESLKGLSSERISHYEDIVGDMAAGCSKSERVAEELERDVEKLKKSQYMKSRLGLEFEGVVTGIHDFGVFVELPNTVEGIILNYNDDAENRIFFGKDGKRLKLGQVIKVKAQSVDEQRHKVVFRVVESEKPPKAEKKKVKAKRAKTVEIVQTESTEPAAKAPKPKKARPKPAQESAAAAPAKPKKRKQKAADSPDAKKQETANKPEAKKADAPKAEGKKPEAKAAAQKANGNKPEAKKAEATKAEETANKPEAKKAESPKPEAKKAEDKMPEAMPDARKAEGSKPEEKKAKAEAPGEKKPRWRKTKGYKRKSKKGKPAKAAILNSPAPSGEPEENAAAKPKAPFKAKKGKDAKAGVPGQKSGVKQEAQAKPKVRQNAPKGKPGSAAAKPKGKPEAKGAVAKPKGKPEAQGAVAKPKGKPEEKAKQGDDKPKRPISNSHKGNSGEANEPNKGKKGKMVGK
jgi:ribonuclease R